jgi:hypothetical protein
MFEAQTGQARSAGKERRSMHPTSPYSYRQAAVGKHPPYGLFLDPHKGQHHWTAVNPYVLLGLVTIIGGAGALVTLISH